MTTLLEFHVFMRHDNTLDRGCQIAFCRSLPAISRSAAALSYRHDGHAPTGQQVL